MVHTKLGSLRSAVIVGLLLAGLAFLQCLFVAFFIVGVGKDGWWHLIVHAGRFAAFYLLIAAPTWWIAISSAEPHRFIRIHAGLVAGLGIPLLVTLVVLMSGLESTFDWDGAPSDGRTRLNPGLVMTIASFFCGYYVTRPGKYSARADSPAHA